MATGETNRLGLAVVVAIGLALRVANAETALVHDDERTHIVGEAMWSLSTLSAGERIRFLREHPRDHMRLYPGRGVVEPWEVTRGKTAFWGHPALTTYLNGLVFAVVRPATPAIALRTARLVSVAADTAALAALPALVRALGAGGASALFAAALYAVYPVAVSSGSIASFDPLLVPLLVLLVRTLAYLTRRGAGLARMIHECAVARASQVRQSRPHGARAPEAYTTVRRGAEREYGREWRACGGRSRRIHESSGLEPAEWLAAGVLSGLLIGTKETGLVVLASVPIAALLAPRPRLVGLAIWAVTTFVVVAAFTSPEAYASRLLDPPDATARMRLDPMGQLVGNLGMLTAPLDHFWIGWTKHGSPRAPLLSRVNVYVAPLYVWAALGALALAAWRRDLRVLLLLVPPIALTLAAIPVTGAVRRLQMIAPLLCALIACELPRLSRRGRLVAAVAALAIAALPLLPLRPGAGGRVDLADLLFHNPQVPQRSTFFSPHQGRPLVMRLPPGKTLERRVWLAPGRYRVWIDASGPLRATLDGARLRPGSAPSVVEVAGHVHRFTLRSRAGSTVRGVTIRRARTRPP
jgi:hypothetical protein